MTPNKTEDDPQKCPMIKEIRVLTKTIGHTSVMKELFGKHITSKVLPQAQALREKQYSKGLTSLGNSLGQALTTTILITTASANPFTAVFKLGKIIQGVKDLRDISKEVTTIADVACMKGPSQDLKVSTKKVSPKKVSVKKAPAKKVSAKKIPAKKASVKKTKKKPNKQ